MKERDLHKNGHHAQGEDSLGSTSFLDSEVPVEIGRILFPAEWRAAANEGLISDEEYVKELIRHSRAENARTVPGCKPPEK